jgi:PAS domain S-box-containing protein
MTWLPSVINKRILILVIFVTMIFAGKTIFDISSDHKLTIASAEQNAKGYASVLNEHAIRTFSDAENTLDAVIQGIEAASKHSVPDELALYRLLGNYRSNRSFISNLFISAPDGHLYADSSEYPVRAVNYSDRDYVRHHQAFQNSDLFVSRPYKSHLDSIWSLSLTKGISNPDGSLRMIVGVSIDPMYFSGFYHTIGLGKNDRIYLLRNDGTVLTQEPFSETALGPTSALSRLIAEELPKAPFLGTYHENDKAPGAVSSIVSYRTTEDFPLISVVSLQANDVLGRWRQRAVKSAGGAILLVLLVGTLGLLVSRQIKELKLSEDKFSLIVTTANEGIWVLDRDIRVTYINQRVADMFGYRPDEMLGQRIGDFMCADELPDHDLRIQRRRQGLAEQYERRFIHKDGSVVWAVISAAAITDDQDGFLGVVGMCIDITDRKRIEEQQARMADQLRQAQKMEAVGILAGGMAHDFNNVLQSILGYISLAKMSVKPGGEVHDYLDQAEEISGQACELGRRLLILSRGGMSFKRSAALTPLLLGTVDAVIKESNVHAEYDLPEDLPLVTFDEAHMEQVFIHLTTNVIEAVRGKGMLRIMGTTISVTEKYELPLPQGYYVHITFSDTGTGIPAELLPKIFDPYFTTKETWSQKGLGLGLALCHTIIRKHNGMITAESAPGKGTTMHLYLPITGGEMPCPHTDINQQLSLSL